jgi:hypothetical protein
MAKVRREFYRREKFRLLVLEKQLDFRPDFLNSIAFLAVAWFWVR